MDDEVRGVPPRGDPRQVFGAELRRVRTQVLRISQDQMAARVGIAGYSQGRRKTSTARASVSLLELGRRAPSEQVLRAYERLTDQPARLRELARAAGAMAPAIGAPRRAAGVSEVEAGRVEGPPSARAGRWRRVSRLNKGRWWLVAAAAAILVTGVGVGVALWPRSHQRQGPETTFTETTGTPAHTWSDPAQAAGLAGKPLGPRQSVQVSCRVRGYVVLDGDPWWYRLESPPWNDRFYATSDAFYNNGSVSGPVDNGVVVDEQVPLC